MGGPLAEISAGGLYFFFVLFHTAKDVRQKGREFFAAADQAKLGIALR